jgi:hypothetical protein
MTLSGHPGAHSLLRVPAHSRVGFSAIVVAGIPAHPFTSASPTILVSVSIASVLPRRSGATKERKP